MADYLPPTENLPIFDTTVFNTAQNEYLTYNQATGLFLTYPIAQGDETLQAITVQGIATFNTALIVSNGKQNTSLGNGYLPLASGQGNQNVVIGVGAGASGLSGDGNTIVGYFSASQGMTSGASQNVLYGSHAGQYLTSGQGNTLIGTTTYNNVTTGNANICLGNGAMGGESSGNLSNNIIIGNGIVSGGSNKTIIGTTTQTSMELRVNDATGGGTIKMNNNLSMNNIVNTGNRQISSSYYNFYATDNNTSLTYSGRLYGNLNSIIYDCPDTNATGSSNHTFYCYNGATPLNSLNINNTALTTGITQPAFNDATNKIPTTAWVQGAITGGGLKQVYNYQVFNSTSTIPSSTSVQMIVPYINTPNFSWFVRLQVDYSLYGNNNPTSAVDPKTLNIIPAWSGALTNVNPNTTAIIDLTFATTARSTVVQSASNAITTLQTYLPNNINASYTYTPFTISTVNQTPTTSQSTVTLTIGFPAVPYTTGVNYRGNITSAAVSIKILSSMGTTSGVSSISNSSAGIAYFV